MVKLLGHLSTILNPGAFRGRLCHCPAIPQSPGKLDLAESPSKVHHRAWEACRGLAFLGPPSFNLGLYKATRRLDCGFRARALVQKPIPMSHPLSGFQGCDDLFTTPCHVPFPVQLPPWTTDSIYFFSLASLSCCAPGKAPFL